MKRRQRGGFVVGLIVGLLLGLVLALGVALYVTKVPIPFVNKVPQRTAEQDAAEAERNRNWDPNAALSGRSSSARAASAPIATPPVNAPAARTAVTAAPGAAAGPQPSTQADPFGYFVQAGAYARIEDAEQQRARLAMLGYAAKVTERDQAGRIVYRVRLGPFEGRDDADSARSRLQGSGIESALVRVQR